ncbi:hypothetical protein SERLA73DRAFT_136403 [Serpula lacrymans var. lacrymans S7.3]|uniref:4a-hydroxytetrahydrobiopterin dehydratase n=2 Tax=Serpula lacrymans var. lacrymans TaxID=341189 RepID=F8PV45_SERL3|nr:hypothetical protein SERLA73DRAFT_136403 [Serpula lacrymans var. lacrymans S7.3]
MPVRPLPTLPSRPGFPIPHLNVDDVDNYVIPLLSRNWRISRAFVSKTRYNLSLSQRFDFDKYSNLMEFLNKLATLSKAERHHPRMIIDKSTVELFLHTHSAYRVRNSDEKPIFHIQQPGVTLCDVRYAIFVDQLFSNEFESMGCGVRYVPKAQGILQELSLREARKRFGEYRPTLKTL